MAQRRNNKLNIDYMCALAKVSRSGYYAYVKRLSSPSDKELKDKEDYYLIKKCFDYKGYKKGARQIKYRLERDYGVIMNLKKIRRIMKKFGLVCPIRRANPIKKMLQAQQSHRTFSNLVNRQFKQGVAKKVLLTDITYLTYGNNKRAYLSTVKDASTNMILAHRVSQTLEVSFVLDTLKQLIDFYGNEINHQVVIHSDQGIHYTCTSVQEYLKQHNIQQSMSRRGNCWDNAPQESFYAILKTEMDLKEYKTYEQVALGIMDYINYYNYDRPQSQLNKLTPSEYDEYLTLPNYNYKYLPMVLNH